MREPFICRTFQTSISSADLSSQERGRRPGPQGGDRRLHQRLPSQGTPGRGRRRQQINKCERVRSSTFNIFIGLPYMLIQSVHFVI